MYFGPPTGQIKILGFCAIFALSTLIAIFSKCSLLFHSLCMVVVVMELKVVGVVVVVFAAVVVVLVVVVSVVVRYMRCSRVGGGGGDGSLCKGQIVVFVVAL